MIFRSLPYPGYSWSLTQHAAGFNRETIEGMITCALPFQGRSNFGSDVTKLMIESNLFTPNERDGKNDAWRDYQQVLPELGLIVSTKLNRHLRLTQISHALVAGELTFEHFANMQVLRYQYPNGHKSDLSSALKSQLQQAGKGIPSSLIELQSSTGVLVKPGLLLLQVLLGLLDKGEPPKISADECRVFVVPCKRNEEFEDAVSDIIVARKQRTDISNVNSDRRLRRNIQDWFKLLSMTTIFDSDGSRFLEVSEGGRKELQTLRAICAKESKSNTFWIPSGGSHSDRLQWFDHFGSVSSSFESQLDLVASSTKIADEPNFEEFRDDDNLSTVGPVSLIEFSEDSIFSKAEIGLGKDVSALAMSVKSGAIKRHAKALLHDQLVLRFANRYKEQGAEVLVDPNSVDLYVKWGENKSAIFEVKTVTKKSMPQRLRLALGQIKEYSFRIKKDYGVDVDQALIIDRSMSQEDWQREFFNDYMNVGVICSTSDKTTVYPPAKSKTSDSW